MSVELRPPLPPPLSHDNIPFIPPLKRGTTASAAEVTAIAAALSALLPPGDFVVRPDGKALFSPVPTPSTWTSTARLEGLQRELLHD